MLNFRLEKPSFQLKRLIFKSKEVRLQIKLSVRKDRVLVYKQREKRTDNIITDEELEINEFTYCFSFGDVVVSRLGQNASVHNVTFSLTVVRVIASSIAYST